MKESIVHFSNDQIATEASAYSVPAVDTMPAIGSSEWAARILDIIERDCMDDFDELCLLMGVV